MTTVEHADISNPGVVNVENMTTVNISHPQHAACPSLGWYPRKFYRDQYLPDHILNEWIAEGCVRVFKPHPGTKQSTLFISFQDVVDQLDKLSRGGRI